MNPDVVPEQGMTKAKQIPKSKINKNQLHS